jgi:antagonist of KipI
MSARNRIHISQPGFLTTVQDLGRYHCAHLGIAPAGAADALSLRIGNLLAGNEENAAALEMTLVGGCFVFESAATVVLTGSDFGAEIPLYSPIKIEAGGELRCGPTRSGARCYLCVRGGIHVPLVLGSASTSLVGGLGGFAGRALSRGDVLSVGEKVVRPPARMRIRLPGRDTIRVTNGAQAAWFEGSLDGVYTVREESDRRALRLSGATPALGRADQLVTEGASLGAIQLPSGGEPIILFVEHPTTGGYPKIANVITADIHALGQLRPRDQIRFEPVTLEQALAALRDQEELIRALV